MHSFWQKDNKTVLINCKSRVSNSSYTRSECFKSKVLEANEEQSSKPASNHVLEPSASLLNAPVRTTVSHILLFIVINPYLNKKIAKAFKWSLCIKRALNLVRNGENLILCIAITTAHMPITFLSPRNQHYTHRYKQMTLGLSLQHRNGNMANTQKWAGN